MGIISKKKKKVREKKREKPSFCQIEIFPLGLMEGNMINAVLEALQEISGLLVTSRLAERLAGVFFVLASLISGVALLITVMYLASPKGFEERLQKVLVEKPVAESPAGEGKSAKATEAE